MECPNCKTEFVAVKPNYRISVWYMNDNHTFTKIRADTPEQAIIRAKQLVKKSSYGMLCSIILSDGDKEVRRVGKSVHATEKLGDTSDWLKAVKDDKDVMDCFGKISEPKKRSFRGDILECNQCMFVYQRGRIPAFFCGHPKNKKKMKELPSCYGDLPEWCPELD